MSSNSGELSPEEKAIAEHLGWVLDMVARIIGNPMSTGYTIEKFTSALAHSQQAARAMGLNPDDLRDRTGLVTWDVAKVWQVIYERYGHSGRALNQIWTALQYENPYYIASYPFPDHRPHFNEQPKALADPDAPQHQVLVFHHGQSRGDRITVRGYTKSDAVRNAYWVVPEAENVSYLPPDFWE